MRTRRNRDRPRCATALTSGVFALLTVAPGHAAQPDSLFHATHPAMGTTFEVYLYAATRGRAEDLLAAAFEEVDRVERLLSTYRPTSELSRLNAQAGDGPVVTDPEVFGFLSLALAISRRTDGAFDPTIGRLVKAWGFYRGRGRYPSDAALGAARAGTGWREVVLDSATRSVRFLVPGLELDPGGIGKGYAIDRVAALLREQGVAAALIGAGTSSYYAIGAPPGTPGWAVRVRDPFGGGEAISTVRLRDVSLSTSGSSEKAFELEGRRYSHIIDPRSGAPVEGRIQVTVIAPCATDSDALSTALFVLGPAGARRMLTSEPETSALFIEGTPAAPRVVGVHWPAEARVDPPLGISTRYHE